MKIISANVDRVITEKNCSAVIVTESGIPITMYVEVINGKINKSKTEPSFWYKNFFNDLSNEEKIEMRKTSEEAVSKMLLL